MPRLKAEKKKKDIQERDICILNEQSTTRGKILLRLVRYVIDGEPKQLQLEKRQILEINGRVFGSKMKGLQKDDIEFVLKSWPEIKGLFS